jgi:hypothetical protein
MAAALKLRTADDVKRLFSALGDDLSNDSSDLSVHDVDQLALAEMPEVDWTGVGISLLVTIAAGYSAVQGYRRNNGSMGWALSWAVLGYLFPTPAVLYSAVKAG